MIKVNVQTKDSKIIRMEISGHALYAEHSKDLVCAGVSSIGFGLCNALDILYNKANIQVNDNMIVIGIDNPDERSEVIMQTGLIQLKTIEEMHKKYIKIKVKEV